MSYAHVFHCSIGPHVIRYPVKPASSSVAKTAPTGGSAPTRHKSPCNPAMAMFATPVVNKNPPGSVKSVGGAGDAYRKY